jgi:hypothetical protein
VITAPNSNPLSDWVTITHPFHPLHGKAFQFLSTRNYRGNCFISLRDLERGTFSVPVDWTDRSETQLYQAAGVQPTLLCAVHLVELAELVETIKNREELD